MHDSNAADRLQEVPAPETAVNAPPSRFVGSSAVEILPAPEKGRGKSRKGMQHHDDDVKERCRMAYVTGKHTLAKLSALQGVPYNTLMRWSSDEKWITVQEATLSKADRELAEKAGKFIAEERDKQLRRSIGRAGTLHKALDKILLTGDEVNKLEANEIRDIIAGEEKVDLIVRRNLGLEDQGVCSGGVRQYAINASSVTFQG